MSKTRYPFISTDAGRSTSARPKQKLDCTVRALALAYNLSYDTVYELLAAAGRQCGKKFAFNEWMAKQEGVQRITFPAKKGCSRMNPVGFLAAFPLGTFIVQVAKHVFVVKDGIAYDETPERPDRCVYGAWKILKAD